MLTGDVAEADAADQPVVTGLHHHGQLVVESLAGPGVVHEAQVHRREMIDGQAPQVVLDSLPELHRRIRAQHPARPVAARADLADQRQPLRIRVQRRPDELVRDVRTVVLRGIDVIDAELGGAPEYRDRRLPLPGTARPTLGSSRVSDGHPNPVIVRRGPGSAWPVTGGFVRPRHRILAMRTHRAGPDYRQVNPAPARDLTWIRGHSA